MCGLVVSGVCVRGERIIQYDLCATAVSAAAEHRASDHVVAAPAV